MKQPDSRGSRTLREAIHRRIDHEAACKTRLFEATGQDHGGVAGCVTVARQGGARSKSFDSEPNRPVARFDLRGYLFTSPDARAAETRPKNAMISPNRIMASMFSMNFEAENFDENPAADNGTTTNS